MPYKVRVVHRRRSLKIAFICLIAAATAAGQTPKRLNHVIEKLEKGQDVIGTFGTPATVAAARAMATSKNDFLMLDLQYGLFDVRQVQSALFAMIDKAGIVKTASAAPGVIPLARIPESTHDSPQFAVKQLLDAGVFGIMFPHMESRDDAELAIRTMRFPQRKGVSFDPADSQRLIPADAAWYWGLSQEEYMKRADVWPLNPQGELLMIAQIESQKGIDHLDEIIDTPGVGAILIGPYHLSESLGEKAYNTPRNEAAVQGILKKCLARKMPCAYPIVATNQAEAQREIDRRRTEGFRILTVSITGR